ncbi:uncharacterized protein L969DRAFT_83782 [Mixia osmundae IAM 14324]|uniref:Uncharacterized protein n=1 Tax=Mixia osmundae (strain CBS 9802 / IAM 14324 / JCM 22182 / KY 12970) TaxID=764103 RepID=G7E3S1_MIXOS|nr:uncharacterized protein L969DRAFT_83782 [Mixia osmundae IAM 14324]KEI41927.1 hypothetical protein L969DRAFT_83782 [Mixia osmundae IAM 14324]GAA97481.1 hypothetical protein E5Q_04159 [Mixia osmundae IAM 14324]
MLGGLAAADIAHRAVVTSLAALTIYGGVAFGFGVRNMRLEREAALAKHEAEIFAQRTVKAPEQVPAEIDLHER